MSANYRRIQSPLEEVAKCDRVAVNDLQRIAAVNRNYRATSFDSSILGIFWIDDGRR
jgi:hypothetical protein